MIQKIKTFLLNVSARIVEKSLMHVVTKNQSALIKYLKKDLTILENSLLSNKAKIYPRYTISNSEIKDYTYIAQNSIINNTTIGKFCSIGPNFICGWGIHPVDKLSTSPMFYSTLKQNGVTLSKDDKIEETKPITIGNDVFIGMNVTILDGIKIGDGAIVGAGAVVSKDIPSYAIAVGVPARVVKFRFSQDNIDSLISIKWWDWPDDKLHEIEKHFDKVNSFIEKFTK